MFIAPLLSDSHFLPFWNTTPGVQLVETQEARRVFENTCHESAFLQSRFNVCGNDLGWQTKIAKTSLRPWQPDTAKISFRTEPLEAPFFTSHKSFKPHRVTMTYEDSESPALWAIPKHKCEFHVFEVDEVEKLGISAADAEAAAESALMALGSTPSALCIYVSQLCNAIRMTSPMPMRIPASLRNQNPRLAIFGADVGESDNSQSFDVTVGGLAHMYATDVRSQTVTGRQAHVSSAIFAPLLQCYRTIDPYLWPEWVKPDSWRADSGGNERDLVEVEDGPRCCCHDV